MGEPLLLPTFFVIGASKAGTTALHRYLARHPEIEMTEPKEPHVLITSDFRERALWYPDLFADPDRPFRGESSTGYTVAPIQAEVPGNIAALIPDARLIYLVRDPVERAIAHYAQTVTYHLAEHVSRHREDRPIEEAVDPDDPRCLYVAASRYGTQVEAYLRHFDPEAILVLDAARLRDSRRQTLETIFAHVGAEPGFWEPAYEQEHNVRAAENVRLGSGAVKLTRSRLAAAYHRALPEGARERLRPRLRRLVGGREVRPDPSPELLDRLATRLAPEADRLRELTGQRFEGWSV